MFCSTLNKPYASLKHSPSPLARTEKKKKKKFKLKKISKWLDMNQKAALIKESEEIHAVLKCSFIFLGLARQYSSHSIHHILKNCFY